MTTITFQDGKPIVRDGKFGIGQSCCCRGECLGPTEWRIVDSGGGVWFTGDIDTVSQPNGMGGFETRWRLRDFPAGCADDYAPEPPWSTPRRLFYAATQATLKLEALGCGQEDWFILHDPTPVTFGQCERISMHCVFPKQSFEDLPESCGCLFDTVGGEIRRTDPNDPSSPCVRCVINEFAPHERGNGLSHLTTDRAVTFTGAVDQEGSNLANWQDANGNSPAAALPNENSDIVIAANLTSWANSSALTVKSITINGCVFAASIKATNLTATDASLEWSSPHYSGPPCVDPPDPAVRNVIDLSGTATLTRSVNSATILAAGGMTFLDHSENTVTGATGDGPEGRLYSPTFNFVNSLNRGYMAGLGGSSANCTFLRTASARSNFTVGNRGTIIGSCSFSTTVSAGQIVDYMIGNYGTITGDCAFNAGTQNLYGTITGDCSFTSAENGGGTITGDCRFDNGRSINSTITGDATFATNSVFVSGDVTGTATLDATSCVVAGGAATAGTFVPDPPPECP